MSLFHTLGPLALALPLLVTGGCDKKDIPPDMTGGGNADLTMTGDNPDLTGVVNPDLTGVANPDLTGVINPDMSGSTDDMMPGLGADMAVASGTVYVGYNKLRRFYPNVITIKMGETVTWEWVTAGHNVIAGTAGVPAGTFCSPNDTNCNNPAMVPTSAAGATYKHTFNAKGEFPYYCFPHMAAMTGTVKVQ